MSTENEQHPISNPSAGSAKLPVMRRYYTENPYGEFDCDSDENALLKTKAKFVYRQSDTPDGMPFVTLRYLK